MPLKAHSHPARPSGNLIVGVVMVAAVCAVASSALLVRWAEASAVALAFWRTLGGSLLLAPAGLKLTKAPEEATREPTSHRRWVLIAGVALAVHFAAWLASLEMTSVAASMTLVATGPIMIAVWEAMRGRPPSRATSIAVAMATVGTAVIALGDLGGESAGGPEGAGMASAIVGDGLALVGAAAVAVYLVAGERARETLPTPAYATRVYGVAATVLAVGVGLSAVLGFRVSLVGFDQATWLAIGAMILGPQLVGHTGLNFLLQRLGSLAVSIVMLAEPVAATLLAWGVLGEVPSRQTAVGAAIVVTGLLVHLVSQRQGSSDPSIG